MMIKGAYEWLVMIAKFNVCAKCKSILEVAWLGSEESYVLGCGQCGYIDAVTRRLSPTEEWRAGAPTSQEYLDQQLGKQRREAMTQEKQTIPFELGGVPPTDLATGQLLPMEKIQTLVNYAHGYQLDPQRGHVCLMYGNPYITIDGYLYHAKQSGRPYSLKSRPMTTEEMSNYKIHETDHAWLAEVQFIDTGQVFTGIGIVSYDEMTAKSTRNPEQLRSPVVATHPWQLTQKRAEWQALRRAFPIGESKEEKE
jgi:hypothetical protein